MVRECRQCPSGQGAYFQYEAVRCGVEQPSCGTRWRSDIGARVPEQWKGKKEARREKGRVVYT